MSSVSTQPGQRCSSAAVEIAAGASGSSRSTPAAHAVAVRDAVDVEQAAARDDMLDVGAAVARGEVAQQRDFAFGARGEVGVPAFRRRRDEAAVDVVQQRLAEAGAGRDQRDVAAAQRLALLQHVHFRLAAAPGPRTPSPADR